MRSKKLTASNGQAIANNGKGLETYVHNMLQVYYGLKEAVRYMNEDMEDGIENEKTIKFLYELHTGLSAKDIGFVLGGPYWGCSPDWLIPGVKGAEFKFQNRERHQRAIDGKFDSSYVWQCHFSMHVCELKEWDLVSYNNNFEQDLAIVPIKWNEKKIDKIKTGIETGIKLIKEYEGRMEG